MCDISKHLWNLEVKRWAWVSLSESSTKTESLTKHVESWIIHRLDEGSNPSDSTRRESSRFWKSSPFFILRIIQSPAGFFYCILELGISLQNNSAIVFQLNYPKGIKMTELTLTTPALLFSSISLIMLAYTNRFLAYASIIRTLHSQYKTDQNSILKEQIKNLRKRLYLTRSMQILGISSLLLCVLTMFLVYVDFKILAIWIFGTALILLIASLVLLIWEIQISVKALEFHINDLES